MALYEHLYDVEVWHRRSKELMREAEEARLAKRLRARHPKRTSKATAAAKWGLLVAALVVAALMLVGASNPAHASTTFTVTNTTDANNLCDADGCSLREAITAANNTPNSGGPDLIRFDIPQGFADPQSGVMSIEPTVALPAITESVTIDGYTQPGSSPNSLARGTNAKLLIELNGENLSGLLDDGLRVLAPNTVVRGLAINRFPTDGIFICCGLEGVRVEGNFIGTDPSGTIDLGNDFHGVEVQGTSATTIGGATLEARNLISGNEESGVEIFAGGGSGTEVAANNKVLGNLIGTKKDGTSALGNSGNGVTIGGLTDDIARNNVVGGATAAPANTIAFNGFNGVEIFGIDSTNNRILRNSIFANGALGVELAGGVGPTPNDPGDADAGPNGLQNKPTIASAVTASGKTIIKGKVLSKPNKTFKVRFFSNPKGNEGKKFIGQKKVSTNSEGEASFTFSPAQKVGVGKTVTATATGSEGTSEFSAPRKVVTQ